MVEKVLMQAQSFQEHPQLILLRRSTVLQLHAFAGTGASSQGSRGLGKALRASRCADLALDIQDTWLSTYHICVP